MLCTGLTTTLGAGSGAGVVLVLAGLATTLCAGLGVGLAVGVGAVFVPAGVGVGLVPAGLAWLTVWIGAEVVGGCGVPSERKGVRPDGLDGWTAGFVFCVFAAGAGGEVLAGGATDVTGPADGELTDVGVTTELDGGAAGGADVVCGAGALSTVGPATGGGVEDVVG